MKPLHRRALWLVLPLTAVAAFAVLLGFSLIRMVGIETDMRIGAEQNMLWVTHQGEVAALRLAHVALMAANGEADGDEVMLAHDILKSRIALMNDGPQRRFAEAAEMADDLDRLRADLDGFAPMLARLTPDRSRALHQAALPFAAFFGRAANKAMIIEWDNLGGRLESYRHQLRQIIAGLVGIMAAGGVLTVMLVLTLRQARRHNRMLARERDFSALLVSSSGEGVLATDLAGRCSLWNQAIARLLGPAADLAMGRNLGDVGGILATQPVQDGLAAALKGQSIELILQPLFHPLAEAPRHVDLRFYPMLDGQRIIGAIIFVHDASDRYAANQHQAAIRNQLENLVAARTRELDEALLRERSAADLYRNFAAMISHQFRTPLAVADSALQRLIRRGAQAQPAEVADRATRARDAIAALTRLVESTLDTARLGVGHTTAQRKPLDLSRMLRDLCARRPDTQDCNIVTAAQGCTLAFADHAHVEQVLDNLLANAARHAPPGTPVTMRLAGNGEQVICDIHNAGPPIADHDRADLFTRGFRGENSAGMPGTGTGLFIARALARMQGGDVTLLPGEDGVTFRLALPQPRPHAERILS